MKKETLEEANKIASNIKTLKEHLTAFNNATLSDKVGKYDLWLMSSHHSNIPLFDNYFSREDFLLLYRTKVEKALARNESELELLQDKHDVKN